MSGYPLDRIYEEVAFIAYHFKWSHEEIMNMEHRREDSGVRRYQR